MSDPPAPGPGDRQGPPPAADLQDRQVVVAVGGGIAAYKVCTLVSRLIQRGCGVTVAMTEAGMRFVGPLTFQALTQRPVHTSLWDAPADFRPGHLSLTETADLLVVAPATADLIGKFAAGIADDLVTTLMIGRDCPVLLAPAMNTRMWENPVVQRNLASLRGLGCAIVEPAEGWLACRGEGKGRMAEPEEILQAVIDLLARTPPRRPQ